MHLYGEVLEQPVAVKAPPGWISLDPNGAPVERIVPQLGIYLVQVLRGLRVKSTYEVVLHLTRKGWRKPSGGVYVPSNELMQRCQRIGDLPGER